jgi:hypothetical protein
MPGKVQINSFQYGGCIVAAPATSIKPSTAPEHGNLCSATKPRWKQAITGHLDHESATVILKHSLSTVRHLMSSQVTTVDAIQHFADLTRELQHLSKAM